MLSIASLSFTCTATLAVALALDALLGEPRRFHPLAGFGYIAGWLERVLNCDARGSAAGDSETGGLEGRCSATRCSAAGGWRSILVIVAGGVAMVATVAPFVWAAAMLPWLVEVAWSEAAAWLVLLGADALVLYLCIGARSLRCHAHAVQQHLASDDITGARRSVAQMVSRDTAGLSATRIATACVESVVENGNDAIFGVFFWYALLGLPGAVAYRLVNTLDAMWGYRTARFSRFGRFAARADDALNYLPARLSAFIYCVAGRFASGWRCWRQQGRGWKSANAGAVMAAGCGALRVTAGGAEVYAGTLQQRPTLGCGPDPNAADIGRAVALVLRAMGLWLMLVWVMENLVRVL